MFSLLGRSYTNQQSTSGSRLPADSSRGTPRGGRGPLVPQPGWAFSSLNQKVRSLVNRDSDDRTRNNSDDETDDRQSQGICGLDEEIAGIEQQIRELEKQIRDLGKRKKKLQVAQINRQMEELTRRWDELLDAADKDGPGSDAESVESRTCGRRTPQDESGASGTGSRASASAAGSHSGSDDRLSPGWGYSSGTGSDSGSEYPNVPFAW